MNRILGVIVTLVWLVAMTALVQRDVLPFWQAQAAPRQLMPEGRYQVAITNSTGRRVGTTWITATPTAPVSTIHSITVLEPAKISGLLPASGPLLIDTDLTFDADNRLQQLRSRIEGAPIGIDVQLGRYGEDYACTARIGATTTTLPLDGRVSECLGESLRPFTHMENLHVGQTWRMRLLDPLELIKGQAIEFRTQLVRVSRREIIKSHGHNVDCYRIETEGATGWADQAGRIVRQEVILPLLGKWVMIDEPFDRRARDKALARVHSVRDTAIAAEMVNEDAP